jgi:hypothetical protein
VSVVLGSFTFARTARAAALAARLADHQRGQVVEADDELARALASGRVTGGGRGLLAEKLCRSAAAIGRRADRR